MTLLPIVARELRVASRRRATYWLRLAAAIWTLVVGTWFLLMMQRQAPAEVAKSLFAVLTGSAGLYCLFSGVRSTADCLSEEKREGTLGLLFLTDLKGYDVVLGKLVASSLNIFYGFIATLPIFAIPLLMGGITLGEFGRVTLVALNAMFVSLSIGVCVSSCSRGARQAMGLTFLILITITLFLPLIGTWLANYGKVRHLSPVFFYPSSGFAYYSGFDLVYRGNTHPFWYSLLLIHSFGWLALAVASFVAPRSWQDRPSGSRGLRLRERLLVWKYGHPTRRVSYRTRLLDINPIYWLASRSKFKPLSVWIIFSLLAVAWFWGWAKLKNDWLNEGVYLTTGVILNVLLKGWVASEAGRQLSEDRHQGALELLVSTPLSVQDILKGHFLALQRQFLAPLLFILCLSVCFLFATLSRYVVESEREMWASIWIVGMVMLVADLYAIYWVGMWQGLRAKTPNRVAGRTASQILLLPWAGMAVVLLILSLMSLGGGSGPDVTWRFFLVLWCLLGLAADLLFGNYAKQKLLIEFRAIAASRYEAPPSVWKRISRAAPLIPPRLESPQNR